MIQVLINGILKEEYLFKKLNKPILISQMKHFKMYMNKEMMNKKL